MRMWMSVVGGFLVSGAVTGGFLLQTPTSTDVDVDAVDRDIEERFDRTLHRVPELNLDHYKLDDEDYFNYVVEGVLDVGRDDPTAMRPWYEEYLMDRSRGETEEISSAGAEEEEGEVPVDVGRVYLNQDTAEQIAGIAFISDVIAERIVSYREENGGIGSFEELRDVRGVGEEMIGNLEEVVSLGDYREEEEEALEEDVVEEVDEGIDEEIDEEIDEILGIGEEGIEEVGCVDLNVAEEDELRVLSGIGEEEVAGIVEERPFEDVSELVRVEALTDEEIETLIMNDSVCV